MYDKSDPRVSLTNHSPSSKGAPTSFAAAEYVKFYEQVPDENVRGTRTWWARSQNFVMSFSEAVAGDTLVRKGQVDEYVALLPDKTTKASIYNAEEEISITGGHIVVVPPGDSGIHMEESGTVVRLFTNKNEDLLSLSINQASYQDPHPNVARFEAWPESPKGFKIRAYSLDVPPQEGRFGRIWRCSTFMVNFLDPSGPRDPAKMSPHSHDDFEQCSLVLQGDYVHHLRYPWTIDSRKWRPDEHETCGTPSVTVIPPFAIHTSQAVNSGINQLVDIFCPPRIDFSQQEGWVLNANDYPTIND
ncbi:hypothetical protein [Alicyclobacillus sp. ALC3]|uniref:hypothetical protein n=1 Tax=Alicyclobacillus sp. ALC3 TaxID=2796143 RepID=UPI0023799E3C|nr:hypothetical protein [Alicyclobacillus sp. ALC3]WDL97753.1 hypothetical protein JC200_03205 [Alicyclobacillus sp. ALC3]